MVFPKTSRLQALAERFHDQPHGRPRFWMPFLYGLWNSLVLQLFVVFCIWLLLAVSSQTQKGWSEPQNLPPLNRGAYTTRPTNAGPGMAISRDEIQRFFAQHEGNSVRTAQWLHRYLRQGIQWQGQVYQIKHYPDSHRVELLVKVLPDTLLYDTVVVLEGQTALNSFIQKGTTVQFQGTIINGVDSFGVKEVLVLIPSPQGIQPQGDYPVSWQEK